MALAGDLTQPTATLDHTTITGPRFLARQSITHITNRAIRICHRLVGFGVTSEVTEPATDWLETCCRAAPQDAAGWAEMATELRLRRIAQQAARPTRR